MVAALMGSLHYVSMPALGQADAAGRRSANPRVLRQPMEIHRYSEVQLPSFYDSGPIRGLDNTPAENPITDNGATLGRVLFYDTRLSANNTVACASCHQQAHAFSDPRKFSIGFAGATTDRNSMPLVDLRYYARGRFFWDERARSLEDQVLMPIQNSHEMGQTLETLVKVISADSNYPALFEKAFGDRQISEKRIAESLAQFVRSLVSYRSKYDKGLAATETIAAEFPNFSSAENLGKNVFLNRCAVCHLPGNQGVIFSAQAPENNGIDGNEKVDDLGVADVTFNRFEAGLFKSPSLRNIEYTAPYMHDGRFATLEAVLDHYSTGVKDHPNLDPRLGGPGGRLRMSPAEKTNLIAFLKTLSDPEFIHDPKFSDPFEPASPAKRVALSKPNAGANQ